MSPRPADWWRASLRAPVSWAGAGLVLTTTGCADLWAETQPDPSPGTALDDQQQSGWNVGSEGEALVFPYAQTADVSGGTGWREALTTLSLRLAPASSRLAPYYDPTLFQALEAPRNEDLRQAMRPILTPEMALASRRGAALLSLLIQDGVCRTDVAVVLDLDGPDSVAVAAALAPCFDPVFVLDNWPHPQGVVPSHLTLAAALYFLPAFERERPGRSEAAAPAFVLDRRRLAPYGDAAGRFDNRYFVGLPPREALQASGIRHLLYVTPDESVTLESEDLNDDLVALDRGGVDVKMLALTDFSERPLPDWPVPPLCGPVVAAGPGQLYFGGSPGAQSCFASWYGWGLPGGSLTVDVPFPPRLGARCRFRPSPRATCFGPPGGAARSAGGWRGGPPAAAAGGGWRGTSGGGSGGWRGSPPGGGAPAFMGGFGRSGSMGRAHFGMSG
jgi:hypothetical protein